MELFKIRLALVVFISFFPLSFVRSATLTVKTFPQLENDSIIKIFAIGNSFSEDAMEHFLFGLAKADGKKVIIGNLFIGASDSDLHWKNASNEVTVNIEGDIIVVREGLIDGNLSGNSLPEFWKSRVKYMVTLN